MHMSYIVNHKGLIVYSFMFSHIDEKLCVFLHIEMFPRETNLPLVKIVSGYLKIWGIWSTTRTVGLVASKFILVNYMIWWYFSSPWCRILKGRCLKYIQKERNRMHDILFHYVSEICSQKHIVLFIFVKISRKCCIMFHVKLLTYCVMHSGWDH